MLAFCGHTWWRKPENPGKTTDLGRATTTLPHADTGIRSRIAAVASECTNHCAIQAHFFVVTFPATKPKNLYSGFRAGPSSLFSCKIRSNVSCYWRFLSCTHDLYFRAKIRKYYQFSTENYHALQPKKMQFWHGRVNLTFLSIKSRFSTL